MTPLLVSTLLLWSLCLVAEADESSGSLKDMLKRAHTATLDQIKGIRKEWEIDTYPNFLKSCQMHKSSWEMLRVRFIEMIVKRHLPTPVMDTFVFSFMGSSVTSGHDSLHNQATPVIAGEWLQPVFDAVEVPLEVRNNAIDNNPCMPYDVCVGTFAGFDADVVHWEQSYNCFDQPMYEQFARQASFLPKQPLVVYSSSDTSHWEAKECTPTKAPKTTLTPEEAALLERLNAALASEGAVTPDVELIVAELNQDEFRRAWNGPLKDLVVAYSGLGIQGFSHYNHQEYACLGPYIPTWMEGAAPWHPSVVGHRLRGAHHAFFWLLALREAIIELEIAVSHGQNMETIYSEITNKESLMAKKHTFPAKRLSSEPAGTSDRIKCYTDVQPKFAKGYGWNDVVIAGKHDFTVWKDEEVSSHILDGSWGMLLIDQLIVADWVKIGRDRGYTDWKYVIYGDEAAGPLSLKLDVESLDGNVYVCAVSGGFGQLPKGWERIENVSPQFYVTADVDYKKPFTFNKAAATLLSWKKSDEFCLMLDKTATMGHHVLTVLPTNTTKFHIGYLLVP